MAGENSFERLLRLSLRQGRIGEETSYLNPHLLAVCDEAEITRAEEGFGVLPRRGEQRDAAGERFKDPDGGDAGHDRGVLAARDMNGEPGVCVDLRRIKVGQIAAVVDAGLLESKET